MALWRWKLSSRLAAMGPRLSEWLFSRCRSIQQRFYLFTALAACPVMLVVLYQVGSRAGISGDVQAAAQAVHDTASIEHELGTLAPSAPTMALQADTADLQRALQRLQALQRHSFHSLLVLLAAVVLALGALMLTVRSMLAAITGPIGHAVNMAKLVAQGDLASEIAVTRTDEIGTLQKSLHDINQGLTVIVKDVRRVSFGLRGVAGEVAHNLNDVAYRITQQAEGLTQITSNIDRVSRTVADNAAASTQANALAQRAAQVAQEGSGFMVSVEGTMASIKDASAQAVEIIGLIEEIASLTNILSLNAAVQAAHAGDHGRGFAVVAGEVRRLSQRTAEAAKNIKEIIGNSADRVKVGTVLVEQASAAMLGILTEVTQVTELLALIDTASSDQKTELGNINETMRSMDEMTHLNAQLLDRAAGAAKAMNTQTQEMLNTVGSFHLVEAEHYAVIWKVRIAWPKHGIVNGRVLRVWPSGLDLEASASGEPGDRLQMDVRLEHNGEPARILLQGEITEQGAASDPKKKAFAFRLIGIQEGDRSLFKDILGQLAAEASGTALSADALRDVDDLRCIGQAGTNVAA